MRKKDIFAIAGAGLLLVGCTDSIMGDHRYQTIPVDNIPYGDTAPEKTVVPQSTETTVTPSGDNTTQNIPAPVQTVSQRKYEPMTDAVSSGGVDSAPRKRTKKGSAKTTVAPVTAEKGVHIIQRGETPGFIAKKYKVRLSALMTANNLTEESAKKLRIGQKLVIPADAAAKTSTRSAVSNKSKKSDSSASAATVENGKYRVQSGDTPEHIARKLKVKLSELLKVNNLDEASARKLQIGQQLIIPGASATGNAGAVNDVKTVDKKTTVSQPDTAPAADAATPPPVSQQTAEMEQELLEVTEDTTLAALAVKYGVTEAVLREINGGITDEVIRQGALIVVPKK